MNTQETETVTTPSYVTNKLAYSVKEAAKAIGVSEDVMYELVHREDFPKINLGRRIIIPAQLLIAWLQTEATK